MCSRFYIFQWKKIGWIPMIFDLENWLQKSEFCNFHGQIYNRALICQRPFKVRKCLFPFNLTQGLMLKLLKKLLNGMVSTLEALWIEALWIEALWRHWMVKNLPFSYMIPMIRQPSFEPQSSSSSSSKVFSSLNLPTFSHSYRVPRHSLMTPSLASRVNLHLKF